MSKQTCNSADLPGGVAVDDGYLVSHCMAGALRAGWR